LVTKAEKLSDIPVVEYSMSENFPSIYIIPLSDTQIGSPSFDESLFQKYVDWILARPNAFTVLPGDIFEAPVLGNKASDFYNMGLTPRQAKNRAKKLFQPLADEGRILAAVAGNHDLRIAKLTDYDPVEILLDSLGLDTGKIYDPMCIVVKVNLGKGFSYKIYMAHGWGGARKTGAHVNKTEEMASVVTDADVYLLGHEHTLYVSRWDSVRIDGKGLTRQVFVGCGTFCRYTRFQKGVQRRFPNLGSPRIRLEGYSGDKGHKDVHVSI
jgi:hypothetical protein